MSIYVLEENVLRWARDRGILAVASPAGQSVKMMEEAVETLTAVQHRDRDAVIDGIGDTLVTLIILARMFNTDINTCLQAAYNEIKDRKGKMVNGVFVKDGSNTQGQNNDS